MSISSQSIRLVSEAVQNQRKKGETAMKFLSIYKTTERGVPPSQEEMDRMGKLVEVGLRAGHLLAVEGCLPTQFGVRGRQTSGKFTVTDGPFAETKEVICGLAILQADSKEQAIEYTKQFLA